MGFQVIAGPGDPAFAAVWREQLLPRSGELQLPPSGLAFGICKLLPGEPSQRMVEYTASFEVNEDASVPAGMVEVRIPAGRYAVKAVPGLEVVKKAWDEATQQYFAEFGEQRPDLFPPFELYPADFTGDGSFFIYIAVE